MDYVMRKTLSLSLLLLMLLVLSVQLSDGTTILNCGFESSSICSFTQDSYDNFDWTRASGSTASSSTGPSSAYSGSYYMYIETSNPRVYGDTAVLYTRSLSLSSGCGRLVFQFSAYGTDLGYLRVKVTNGVHTTQQLWSHNRQSISGWQQASVYFKQEGNFRILFEGVRGVSYKGDYAIDAVTVTTVNASYCDAIVADLLYCDFERSDSTCGFSAESGGVYSWTRHQGTTPSGTTGPSFDYTTGHSSVGYYYYTEVTPRTMGDRFIHKSPSFNFTDSCGQVKFAYHAYGSALGTMRVYLQDDLSLETDLWSLSGTSENNWRLVTVDVNDTQVTNTRQYNLVFEVTRGNGYQGDFAIDNVQVTGGCTVNNATDESLLNATEIWGRITSPNFPGHYSNNQIRTWYINPSPHNNVVLKFTALSVEGSNYDYVTVNGVKYISRPTSSIFITGVSTYVTVYFRSDSSVMYQGFELYYKATAAPSSSYASITETDYSSSGSGTISSPLYPSAHYGSYDYWWIISARYSYVITITFTNIDMRDTTDCAQDFVKIFDGKPEKGLHTDSGVSATYALMGKYCGFSTPPQLTTTQNSSMVVFQTNENGACCYSGFSLSYSVLPVSSVTLSPGSTSPSYLGWGRLTSPNYPLTYGHNSRETWVLNAYPSSYIRFNFADLNLESGYDYVSIDGNRYYQASSSTNNIVVYKQVVTVLFYSDGSVSENGFDLFWKGTNTTTYAGITYNSWTSSTNPASVSGTIYGRNTYESYGSYDRWWIFNAPYDYVVQMTVSSLDITSSTSCASGSLKIYDGIPTTTGSYALIASLCGTTTPTSSFVSTMNASMVVFNYNANSYSASRYFAMSFYLVSRWNSVGVTASPGGSGGSSAVTASFGRITSPNFPGYYPNSMNKYWVVNGSPSLYLRFRFTHLSVESNHDYVEIDNYRYYTSSSYSWTVYKQIATVYFHSDSSVNRQGFELFWKGTNAISSTRGGISHTEILSTGTTYNIQSSNYGSSHTGTYDWWWILEADEGSTISFEFEALSMPSRNSCSLDYVKIYDGIPTGDGTYSLLQKSCGSTLPSKVTTTKNNSMVMFFMDENTVSGYTGFKLKYTAQSSSPILPMSGLEPANNDWIGPVVGAAVAVILIVIAIATFACFYGKKKSPSRNRRNRNARSGTNMSNGNGGCDGDGGGGGGGGVTNPAYGQAPATMAPQPQPMMTGLHPVQSGYMYIPPGPTAQYPPPQPTPMAMSAYPPAASTMYPPPPPISNNGLPPVNFMAPPTYEEISTLPQPGTSQYPPPPPPIGGASAGPFTVQPAGDPMYSNQPPSYTGFPGESKTPLG